jgi:hypothetical protein
LFPVQTLLRVRLNNLAGFMLCGKTVSETHKTGSLSSRYSLLLPASTEISVNANQT